MDALIAVFYNYSGNDGDKYKLNKGELKQLLNSELTDFLTVNDTFYQHDDSFNQCVWFIFICFFVVFYLLLHG